MFRSIWSFAKFPVLATALLLTVAEQSDAQWRGGNGRGWGGGGGGYYGGGGSGVFIGGRNFSIGIGNPGYYGYNQGYYGYNRGYYGPQYYGGSYYQPANYYSYQPYNYSWSPTYTTAQPIVNTTGYLSNYPPANVTQTGGTENTAMVEVIVPADAELWFDGTKTQQTGGTRYFVTPPLTPGKTYTYEVRISPPTGGDAASATREVQVQAGKRSTVNFLESVGPSK